MTMFFKTRKAARANATSLWKVVDFGSTAPEGRRWGIRFGA